MSQNSGVFSFKKHYRLLLRIAFAIFSANFIVMIAGKRNIFELLILPAYWAAVSVSFFVAFVIIEGIYRLNNYLNRKYPQQSIFRLLIQIILCSIAPLLFAFLVIALYFNQYGINISDTAYFTLYFPLTLLYVLFLNCYYNWDAIKGYAISDEASFQGAGGDLEKDINDHDWIMIHREGRFRLATMSSGEMISWNHNLKLSIAALPDDFYQVNRQCIIRHDYIERVTWGPGASEFTLFLKSPLEGELKVPVQNAGDFTSWWDRKRGKNGKKIERIQKIESI